MSNTQLLWKLIKRAYHVSTGNLNPYWWRVREFVKKRDNYTCIACGYQAIEDDEVVKGVLDVHHLNDKSNHKSQALDPDNCVTMCNKTSVGRGGHDCHGRFHRYMGGTHVSCTRQDMVRYLKIPKKKRLTSK